MIYSDLNGIKFHRQGKQPRAHDLDRFKKITRSKEGHLMCQGNKKAKLHQEHNVEHHGMANDFIGTSLERGLDVAAVIWQTKYPRYNGRDAPLPFDELLKKEDLTHLEPENEFEFEMLSHPDEFLMSVRDEEFDFEEIEFPSDEFISPVIVDEGKIMPR